MAYGFVRKFVHLVLPLVVLSTVLVVTQATQATPAAAAPPTCSHPGFGGVYYCGYGVRTWRFSDGTTQIFVIGTDFAVWTRWLSQGFYSLWYDLGGEIRGTNDPDDFAVISCKRQGPIVQVVGTDNRWWSNVRRANGSWTGWNPGSTFVC